MRNIIPVIIGLLLLSACTVGPDYQRPEMDVPRQWTMEYTTAADFSNAAWWNGFGDPVLNRLVETAVRQNLDLQTAAARVDQFAGLAETTRAQFFPKAGVGADIINQRSGGMNADSVQVGLNAYWELDLWGRIRRTNEAARAQFLASEQGRRGVLMALVSNVAAGYISLRGLDRQLEIARKTERAYAETLDLFTLRFEYGTISQIQLSQALSLYESARTAVPRYESLIRQQENLLAVLMGQLPGEIPRGKEIDDLIAPGIPAGLPSEILERRPDIIQAEQAIVAANAQIGVARAAYFPTISLTGALGSVSGDLSGLLTGGSGTSALGAGLAAPLLNFGAISGQVAQSEALKQQALYQYRQAVLNAFREVEDALVKTAKGREEADAQKNQVDALELTANLARFQYENGTVDYLHVLDAERSLFAAQLENVRKKADVLGALISVYKAMGGGWIDQADLLGSEKKKVTD